MGPPGVGVGTCMRMVEPVLMVSKLYSFDHADPIVSIEVSDSKGDATGYRVWTNCRGYSSKVSLFVEVCVPWRADS